MVHFVSNGSVAGRPSHPFEDEQDGPVADECFYRLVEKIEAARIAYAEVRFHLSEDERKSADWIDASLQDALSDARGLIYGPQTNTTEE